MNLFGKGERPVIFYFLILLSLSGCGEAGPECGSPEVRNSVVKIVSDDKNNRLLNFAVQNSDRVAELVRNSASANGGGGNAADAEAEKRAIWEKAKQDAIYALDEAIAVHSRIRTAATCTGLLSVRIGDTTVQKEVEFRVDQTADGTVSVSVKPFLF